MRQHHPLRSTKPDMLIGTYGSPRWCAHVPGLSSTKKHMQQTVRRGRLKWARQKWRVSKSQLHVCGHT